MEITTRVFTSGNSQAIRIPKQFRLDVDEVVIAQDEKTGNLIISKKPRKGDWARFFALRDAVPDEELKDFLVDRKQPPQQDRDLF